MAESTDPIIGYGKHIAYSSDGGSTYTSVGKTTEVKLPERELGTAEITNDDSPDFHKEYIPALYEPGTVTFSYIYTAAQFAALETIYQLAADTATRADATKTWKVTFPDGSTSVFDGFMTKHDLPLALEDGVTVEAEIQVSGQMTFTAGMAS